MISERIKNLEYAIRDLIEPAKNLEKKSHKIIKLNIGDPVFYGFDTPNPIKSALAKAVNDGKNLYADSQGENILLEAIARREKRLNEVDVNKDNIIILAGISEGINFLFASLVDKNDEVLVPSPSYPPYISFCKFYGGKPVEYKCNEENNWNPDIDDIEKKINKRTRAFVFINPNNPTSSVYDEKIIKEIINIVSPYEIPIITDEIYDELVYKRYKSVSSLAKDIPCITLNGISKKYLATGWRLGYAIFNKCDDLFEACMKLARIRLCANTPAQYAFAEALKENGHIKNLLKEFRARMEFSFKRCNEIDGLSCIKPGGAFYLFPKIDECKDDKQWVLDLLNKKHILVVHGSGFGEYGKNHFRMVTLSSINVLEEVFNEIESFIKSG